MNESLSGNKENLKNNVKEQRKTKRQFWLICFALLLVFSGYSSVLLLQSSINIVDGVGATATSISYSLSVFFGLFFAPSFVRLAGVKRTLLFSEVCYLFYVVANCYPTKWLILMAAVSVGVGEALYWVMFGIIFVHFGQVYHKYTINRTQDSCVREFSGIIFSIYQLNPIVGNTLVFFILHYWNESEIVQNRFSNTTSTVNTTEQMSTWQTTTSVVRSENDRLFYCGANDCQNANLTQQNLGNYRPTDPVALYALIATFAAIMLAGIVLQAYITPDIPINYDMTEIAIEEGKNESEDGLKERGQGDLVLKPKIKNSLSVIWLKGIKDIFWRALSLNQLLLYPASIYYGLVVGFLFCEATRTYASCVKGVSQVGLCCIIYAAANGTAATVFGKVASKFALQPVYICAFILDTSVYILFLFWIPTVDSSWVVYLIFVLMGFMIAMWNLITTNTYSESFKKHRELSFTMWSALFSIGFAMQFGWSTFICVREKVYILIAFLATSFSCLQILRYKLRN